MKTYLLAHPCLFQYRPEISNEPSLKQNAKRIKQMYNHKFKNK